MTDGEKEKFLFESGWVNLGPQWFKPNEKYYTRLLNIDLAVAKELKEQFDKQLKEIIENG